MHEVHPGGRHHHFGGEMRGAAEPDRRIVELPRSLPGVGDEFLQVARGVRGLDQHHLIAHRHHGHRQEVALPVVRQVLVQRGRDGQRAVGREIERMAVGLGARRELGPDHAAGAGPVVDHELLPPDAPTASDRAGER